MKAWEKEQATLFIQIKQPVHSSKEKKDLHLEHKNDELDSWKGWISVGCTFAVSFVCFGVVHSFGAFFDSISSDFSISKSATSAVFSVTIFIFLLPVKQEFNT